MAINLLPPKFKQEKKIKKTAQTISIFLTTVFIIILILTGSILAADYSTKKDLDKVNAKIEEENKILLRYKATEDSIKAVNSKLGKIESVNTNRILWSNLIVELSKLTPSQIQIKTMVLDKENNKVSLTGFAETRSDIARFKEKMSSSKYFKNVTFSSSVHNEQQGNFSFSISSEIGEIK
ncbi:MAG: PilN domain-containing protein [Patescibacteria group bacterium]|nr:PilN domain-containing protein [Patescibacteria group bacterium]